MSYDRENSRTQRKVNLRDLAYERIIHNLSTAKLSPGQFICQRELVEMTEVPLAAVREVIPRLEAEKLLKTIPRRGIQISNVDLRMVKDAFQLNAILVKAGAEKVVSNASDDLLDKLLVEHKNVLARTLCSLDEWVLNDAARREEEFSRHLVGALENEIISTLYKVNRIKVEMIKKSYEGDAPSDIVCSIRERIHILDVLKRRNRRQALSAMESYADNALQLAIKNVDRVTNTPHRQGR